MTSKLLVLDSVTDDKHNARALIVGVLSEEPKLSPKAIHARIGERLTYQAVHKAARQLLDAGVLLKEDGKYQLSSQWLEELKAFYEKASNKTPELKALAPGTITQIYFESYLAAGTWYIEETAKLAVNREDERDCAIAWRHMLPVTAFNGSHFEEMKAFFATGRHYGICKGNTKLDRFIAKYWRKLGKTFLLGEKTPRGDYIAVWNFLLQFHPSKAFTDDLDSAYRTAKSESEGLAKAHELFGSKKYPVLCIVSHDKKIAQTARELVIDAFKKRGKRPN